MEKPIFILQKGIEPNTWCCTDTLHEIVCTFKNGKFVETHKFTMLEDPDELITEQVQITACQDIVDWLRDNHYDKLFL
jgi:hypothetical protein